MAAPGDGDWTFQLDGLDLEAGCGATLPEGADRIGYAYRIGANGEWSATAWGLAGQLCVLAQKVDPGTTFYGRACYGLASEGPGPVSDWSSLKSVQS